MNCVIVSSARSNGWDRFHVEGIDWRTDVRQRESEDGVKVSECGLRVLVALAACERTGAHPTIYRISIVLGATDATIYHWLHRFVAHGLTEIATPAVRRRNGRGARYRLTKLGWQWLQTDSMVVEEAA